MRPLVDPARLAERLRAICRRFVEDERGWSVPLTGAVMIPLMGFIGLGTDAARGYLVKARLGDALDAAVLAAAHERDDSKLQSEIQKYFNVNFPPGYMGAEVTLYDADPQVTSFGTQTIDISASAVIDTTFMRLFGFNTLGIGTETEVTRQTVNMDVVLSMDMSWSMNLWGGGGTRISAARTAAHTLVDVLYGNQTSSSLLNIGLVPWNGAVNVWRNGTPYNPASTTSTTVASFTNPWSGDSQTEIFTNPVTPVPLLEDPDPNWEGCIFARYTNDLNNPNGIADHLIGPVTTSDNTEWLAWPTDGSPDDSDFDSYSDCLAQGITPLTGTRATIDAAIDDLNGPDGVTNIAQGLVWAWRVVSPGVPFDEADPNPTGLHERAIVLLTDGEQWGGDNDGYNAAFGTGTGAGGAGMDARLKAIAANVKAGGVKIYVIQFANANTDLAELLRDHVATAPFAPFYHNAPTGAELEKVFKAIGDDLSALRISK